MEEKKMLKENELEKVNGGVDMVEELKNKIKEAKSEDELLKILDEDGQELSDDEIILPGTNDIPCEGNGSIYIPFP